MKTIKILGLALALVAGASARERLNGFCEQGAITVNTLTAVSTTAVQGSYPSCTVTVYLTGTLTLATLFSDNSSTPLANPFTADSSGRWGFFADDGSYDVRFAGGGLPAPYVRTGAGLFDGSPSAQGTATTVVRGIKDKLKDFLSVKDFGAKGDGATDDTVAINLALAQSTLAKGNIPGVCIYFPDGIYRVTSMISVLHPVCLTGNQWRLKYTAGSPITSVFALIGDVANVYGSHGGFLEGSSITGMIVDGQGNATNGLTLQGVVSAQMSFVRATNVTGTGINCNWCQQVTFDHVMVSNNFENFSTVPQFGITIDNASSANYITNCNFEHVSSHGLNFLYAINTTVIGGTSEGNGGYGVYCFSGASPFHQCFQNTFIQFDTEVNTSGDYLFGDSGGGGAFFNSIIQPNSFSVPGISFANSAHGNTVVGGSIGGGSNASALTSGNRLVNVSCISLSASCWTDLGQNYNDRVYNQFNASVIEPVNNNNKEYIMGNGPGGYRLDVYTPTPTYAEMSIGLPDATHWIGFTQNGAAVPPWFVYPISGFQFQSLSTFRGTALPDGAIVNHKWGFGRFNTAPVYQFHFLDAVTTTVVDQSAAGQGGNSLHEWRDKVSNSSTLFSSVDFQGAWLGPVTARHTGGVVTTVASLPACPASIEGRMEPVSDATSQTWGAAVAGGGAFHVLAYCGSGGWTVMGK